MFERSLPWVAPTYNNPKPTKPNQYWIQNHLGQFDDFCRFEFSFISVWPVWLEYHMFVINLIFSLIHWHDIFITMTSHEHHKVPAVWVTFSCCEWCYTSHCWSDLVFHLGHVFHHIIGTIYNTSNSGGRKWNRTFHHPGWVQIGTRTKGKYINCSF